MPQGFVLELSPDLPGPRVGYGSGEPPVPHHSSHVQIFDDDSAISRREMSGQLVYAVLTKRGDAMVDLIPCADGARGKSDRLRTGPPRPESGKTHAAIALP
jgi:hypothetical protein